MQSMVIEVFVVVVIESVVSASVVEEVVGVVEVFVQVVES